jgi:hypothetical protein
MPSESRYHQPSLKTPTSEAPSAGAVATSFLKDMKGELVHGVDVSHGMDGLKIHNTKRSFKSGKQEVFLVT